jgi:glutathione S-transferase
MADLILTTFDWVPEMPRGFVRDLRVRWALEEAGLPYRVESVPSRDRSAEHFAHQPFGQVPWLTDGDISIFESGAILLHLGERSEALMPADPRGRAETIEWLFAALNSVEMASLPWALFQLSGDTGDTPGWKRLDQFLKSRLQHMEKVLAGREWLAGTFSVATSSWRMCYASSTGSTGWRDIPPAATMSRAPRPARALRKRMLTRWRILLRQTDHRRR